MSFQRPTVTQLIDRIKNDIETRLPGTDAKPRRTLLGVLGRTLAGAVHGLYGYLNWMADQLMPDTAEKEHLERWSSIWGVTRIAAVKAVGSITFTGTDTTVVPAGTIVQRADGVEFSTDADGTITSGVASIAATASVAGAEGNTDVGSTLQLTSPIAGVDSNATVDAGGLVNGADEESDDSLRSQLLRKIQQPPYGGTAADYVTWTQEVNEVTRAWCYPGEDGVGTVKVRCVVDDNAVSIIPDAAKITEVQTYIDSKRPVTADVTVVAPVAVPLDFTIAITPNAQAVKDAIQAELEDLLRRESEPGGTILLSHIQETVSLAAGEEDHTMTSPSANVVNAVGDMSTMGVITWA